MKRMFSALLMLAMLLSLAACGGNNETGGHTANPGNSGGESGNPAAGATAEYYNTYLSADPTSMDISRVSDSYSSGVINNIMEGLVRLGETEDGEYEMLPGDAQTWDLSEDGTVWTFHLGGNKWSDGKPVTADDYVYSLRRSVDPATGCPNEWFLYPIAGYDAIRAGESSADTLGVRAIDEKTLEITLSFPMASFLEMCSGTIYYPQYQEKVEEYGEQYGTEPEYTVFNGPYVMSQWTHNSKIVLTKNEQYWDAGSVSIETVNISILSDPTTIYNAFETGDLDYVSTYEAEWIDKFSSRGDVKAVLSPTASLGYSFYNCQDELFQNANIRKAFTLAMDREELNKMCFGGANIPTYGWICPAISVGETNFRAYAGDTIREMAGEMEAEGMTARDYLLKGMEELGLGSDPSALTVTFSLAGTDDWFRTYGEYLQQSYESKLGVHMEISFNDWAIFYDDVQNGNYQIGYMSWTAYYNDPYDMLSLFVSSTDAIETGWASAEYDQLIADSLKERDEAARLEVYKRAEDILLREECVVCPILTYTSNAFYHDYVTGYDTQAFSVTGYKGMSTGGR